MTPRHDLVEELVAIRYKRRLTGAEVAARMCCSRSNVSQFETQSRGSSPTLATVLRYAAAVGARITVVSL